MDVLILAAGYGTRLYPLTRSMPKALLDINGKPILEYILKGVGNIPAVEDIYIVTNGKFYEKFEEWNKNYDSKREIVLINNGTTDDENKLGAIRDMQLSINERKIDSDLLIVAGDNIFEFDLRSFYDFYKKKNSFCVGLFKVKEPALVSKYSNVKLDKEERITDFVEKPSKALSDLIAICLYIFPQKGFHLIQKYIEKGNNPDAPGYFIQWLVKREKVYGFGFEGKWLDIGDINSYNKAKEEFRSI